MALATSGDRPLFLLVHYRHETELHELFADVRREIAARGFATTTLDPPRREEHALGNFFDALCGAGDATLALIADLPRDPVTGLLDPEFLRYLNLNRNQVETHRLRWLLPIHVSEIETFVDRAGDLWDVRHRTFWLERQAGEQGQEPWRVIASAAGVKPTKVGNAPPIGRHMASVRRQIDGTTDPAQQAGLLLDLAGWLRRRAEGELAIQVAGEGLELLQAGSLLLRADLERTAGLACFDIGRPSESLSHFERELQLRREIGDRVGEGRVLNSISQVHHSWRRYDAAQKALEESLRLRREVGDRVGEATTLTNLGAVLSDAGRHDAARSYLEKGLAVLREVGNRYAEASTLNNLAGLDQRAGEPERAQAAYEQALEIYLATEDQSGAATVLNNLWGLHHDKGDYERALEVLQESRHLVEVSGSRRLLGGVLNNLAHTLLAMDRLPEARANLEQSIHLLREVGDPAGEASAFWNLSLLAARGDDPRGARAAAERAVELWKQIGAPEAARAEARLADLAADSHQALERVE